MKILKLFSIFPIWEFDYKIFIFISFFKKIKYIDILIYAKDKNLYKIKLNLKEDIFLMFRKKKSVWKIYIFLNFIWGIWIILSDSNKIYYDFFLLNVKNYNK